MAAPNQFTAYIPNIDTAKSWMKWIFGGSVGTAFASWFANAPVHIQIMLAAIPVIVLIGMIVMFIKYHREIFAYVTQMNTVRAQPETANFVIKPHKK